MHILINHMRQVQHVFAHNGWYQLCMVIKVLIKYKTKLVSLIRLV